MLITNLNFILSTSSILFTVGMSGLVFNRKNILIIIISIELMLLAANFNFIIFSVNLDDVLGQIFVFFILTVAASESSIGLGTLISYYRIKGYITADLFVETIKH